ncbi:MAG: hypothetical protein WBD25_02850 [Terriglobales bacterium]|jgi:hypothetical protein
MFWRLSLVLLAATVSVPLSNAQMRGTHAGFGHGAAGRIGRRRVARLLPREMFPGSSYLYPNQYQDYYPDEQYTDGGASPQVVIVRPTADEDSPRNIKPGPLLIEWQGDRYVRFGGSEETGGRGTSAYPDYAEPAAAKSPTRQISATKKERTESSEAGSAPVVLVYRDGHREEIPDYAIANGVIYAHGTYWQNGYWTKQIPLSALDPSATMQANRERGAKFMLPSAPNVVITSF